MKIVVFIFIVCFPSVVCTQPFYVEYGSLLAKYVDDNGTIDYKGLAVEKIKLENTLDIISSHSINEASAKEQLAYYINLYNGYTLLLIVKNYPLTSIMNLENGKVWDKKWIKIGTKSYSLNQIEHEIIRPRFKDARIHFALNCSAKSCPPLLNKVYLAESLEDQLDTQTKKFIQKDIELSKSGTIKLSKLFEWYKTDFGNIFDFLNRYHHTSLSAATIEYKEYDWALNKK